MGVLPGACREHAKGGGHSVAPAIDGELYDVFWVEVLWVRGKRGRAGVLDTLVDRED